MKTQVHLITRGSVLALSLLVFSGCDWFKSKEAPKAEASKDADTLATAGTVLCTINGEAAIKEADFINSLNQMIQSNPYFKGASIESLPKELQRKFFEQLATQAIIEKYAIKNNIEKDPEYIKAYNETEKLLKRSLMVQIFEKKIYDTISVSDNDIVKYYNENKDKFVKVAGGVLVAGCRFDNDEAATAFAETAKANIEAFEKLAKDDKAGKFRDFGRVSKEAKGMQYEAVPGPVKESALAMSKVPGIEKVKAGKDFWVIKVWDKKNTVLFDRDEVKQHIEAMIKNNQFRDALEKRVKELRGEFSITINEDYFKDTAPADHTGHNHEEGEHAEAEEPSAAV